MRNVSRNRKTQKWMWILPLALAVLCGCSDVKAPQGEVTPAQAMKAQEAYKAKEPVVGLILTSQDADENEEIISRFQEEADRVGASLLIRIPEVSEAEALEAAELTESFVLCDVDPIECQMLLVDDLVAEGVDVIAIRANHGEALEPVLSAARTVGIRVCAFGRPVTEGSFDCYAEMEDAAAVTMGLLDS